MPAGNTQYNQCGFTSDQNSFLLFSNFQVAGQRKNMKSALAILSNVVVNGNEDFFKNVFFDSGNVLCIL
jgi:hypothetical protein